jgi:hypothetical protein
VIHLHTFRHWKGTIEYHKTHDLIHMQQILRHRDIKSTMLYIHVTKTIFQSSNDEVHVSVAKTVEEACKLVEVGFKYVAEINGAKIFRKRK